MNPPVPGESEDRLNRVTRKLKAEGYPLTEEQRKAMRKAKRFNSLEDLPLFIRAAINFLYDHREWDYYLSHDNSNRGMRISVTYRGNLSAGFGGKDWSDEEQNHFLQVANQALCEVHDRHIASKRRAEKG